MRNDIEIFVPKTAELENSTCGFSTISYTKIAELNATERFNIYLEKGAQQKKKNQKKKNVKMTGDQR